MTPETETEYDPARNFRVPDSEWTPFEAATRAIYPEGRSPRGKVLREFMRWYMRRPGAKLPERPPAGAWSTQSDGDGQSAKSPQDPQA
ncbi:hypothetical protein ACWEQO_02120 [Streptomyces sp. NPDC004051]